MHLKRNICRRAAAAALATSVGKCFPLVSPL